MDTVGPLRRTLQKTRSQNWFEGMGSFFGTHGAIEEDPHLEHEAVQMAAQSRTNKRNKRVERMGVTQLPASPVNASPLN